MASGASPAPPDDPQDADAMAAEATKLIPRLRRYARVLVHDSTLADDFVQEALLRGLSRAHLFRPGTDLRAWLFTILHNTIVSTQRRERRRTELNERHLGTQRFTPANQEHFVELRQTLRSLRRLKPAQRELLLRAVEDGASYQQLAKELAIPIGTVRSRLSRARVILKNELAAGTPHAADES